MRVGSGATGVGGVGGTGVGGDGVTGVGGVGERLFSWSISATQESIVARYMINNY